MILDTEKKNSLMEVNQHEEIKTILNFFFFFINDSGVEIKKNSVFDALLCIDALRNWLQCFGTSTATSLAYLYVAWIFLFRCISNFSKTSRLASSLKVFLSVPRTIVY